MKHISDTELDKYLEKHALDLEINMIKLEGVNSIASETKITSRLTGEVLLKIAIKGIPDDEEIINMIKPIIRHELIQKIIE